MFLHINTLGQQLSVHAKDLIPAEDAIPGIFEEKDKDGNVTVAAQPAIPAKAEIPAEPLLNAIKEAMDYWKKVETDIVAISNGVRLDLTKAPAELGLVENDLVSVVTQRSLDEVVEKKQEELNAAKKLAGKL